MPRPSREGSHVKRARVKKVVGAAVVASLAVGGIACWLGGGTGEVVVRDVGPRSTEELLERYEALEDRENYAFESSVDVALGVGRTVAVETAGKAMPGASHVSGKGSVFGFDATYECYVETQGVDHIQYRSYDIAGTRVWARSAVEGVAPLSALTAHDLLEDATFAQTSDGYTLGVPGNDFAEACVGVVRQALPDLAQEVGASGLTDVFALSEAVYTFDSDCALREISYRVGTENEAAGGAAASIECALHDYGTVDAEAVAVPESVRDASIDLDEVMATISGLKDRVGDAVGDVANRVGEGLDQLDTYLDGIDASSLVDQLKQRVSDVADSGGAMTASSMTRALASYMADQRAS
jgi:hypothetical protein